jgi:hypothetical protein
MECFVEDTPLSDESEKLFSLIEDIIKQIRKCESKWYGCRVRWAYYRKQLKLLKENSHSFLHQMQLLQKERDHLMGCITYLQKEKEDLSALIAYLQNYNSRK